jgi:hypothetical protein
MSVRERLNDELSRNDAGSCAESGGGNLESLRAAGRDFLTAGSDAINRALSGDSEAFLKASEQQGGQ